MATAENIISDVKPVSEPSPADKGDKKHSFISAGERIHKWGTYLGVDWLFNAAAGVGFSFWGKYSELGKKVWSQPITNFFTRALKPLVKDPANLEKSVEKGNIFVSVIMGGMFTIPPLLVLESKKVKRSIIESLDRHIYGKDKVAHDPKFAQAYTEIDNEPRKGFVTGMLSRFAALAPLLAMVLITPSRKFTNKYYFDHVHRLSAKTWETVGITPEKLFKNHMPQARAERWNFIHDNVAMDFGLGVPYAVMHSIFYNLFAKLAGGDKKEKQAKPETHLFEATVIERDAVVTQTVPAQTYADKIPSKAKPAAKESFTGSEILRKTESQQPVLG